jgi:hypothetical protein
MDLRRAVSAPGYRDAHQPRRAGRPASLPPTHPKRRLSVQPNPAANMRESRTCCEPADMGRSLPHNRDSRSSVRDASTFCVSQSSPLCFRVAACRSAARIPQLWLCSSPHRDANGQTLLDPIHCRHMKPLTTGPCHQLSSGAWIFDACTSATTVQTMILVHPQPGCATVGSHVQGME